MSLNRVGASGGEPHSPTKIIIFHELKVLCVRLDKCNRQKHLTHIISDPFLCQAALDSNGCSTLRFVVSGA